MALRRKKLIFNFNGLVTMYKILVVDDEVGIRSFVKKYAEFEGHEVIEASDGMEAVTIFRAQRIDIIIMDIMMPELDGFSAVREIRKTSNVPIIMLSARGEEYDKINGFNLGIDDYVVKPFSPRELILRIEAVMKRAGIKEIAPDSSEKPHEIIEIDGGKLKADVTARIVYIDDERIDMSPKEYELFYYMLINHNIALSREKLICEVWGYDFYGDARTLDTHIKLLRKSLGRYSSIVVTLRGIGYRLEGKIVKKLDLIHKNEE